MSKFEQYHLKSVDMIQITLNNIGVCNDILGIILEYYDASIRIHKTRYESRLYDCGFYREYDSYKDIYSYTKYMNLLPYAAPFTLVVSSTGLIGLTDHNRKLNFKSEKKAYFAESCYHIIQHRDKLLVQNNKAFIIDLIAQQLTR